MNILIVAFVGTITDESETPISGNGKTCSMTGLAYLDYLKGKQIWSNYKTTFSEEEIGLQAMIDKIGKKPHPNLILCVSEMQQLLNSIGSNQNEVLFIDAFASQLRKLQVNLYYDTQRFNNIHKRLRIHTDVIFMPMKYHFDNTQCNYNNCRKPHKIYLYSHKPRKQKWRCIFDAGEVGKLYNSGEIIEDILRVPAKKKKFEKEGDDIE